MPKGVLWGCCTRRRFLICRPTQGNSEYQDFASSYTRAGRAWYASSRPQKHPPAKVASCRPSGAAAGASSQAGLAVRAQDRMLPALPCTARWCWLLGQACIPGEHKQEKQLL